MLLHCTTLATRRIQSDLLIHLYITSHHIIPLNYIGVGLFVGLVEGAVVGLFVGLVEGAVVGANTPLQVPALVQASPYTPESPSGL